MFWNRKDKVFKVQIMNNLEGLTQAANKPTPPAVTTGYDLPLKLAALISLILNGCLAIMGYVDIMGQLATFGIGTSEIEPGLPMLLFQGYITVVLSLHHYIDSHFPLGILAIVLTFTLALYPLVSKLPGQKNATTKFATCLFATTFFLLITLIPQIGFQRGQNTAYRTFERQNFNENGERVESIRWTKTITTKEGKTISGGVVFSSAMHTFVLQGSEVFKIANSDNHLVSTTKLSPGFAASGIPK